MTTAAFLFGIAAPLLMMGVIFDRLRRRRLRERHALWWLLAALCALVVGIFPATLTKTAQMIGVEVPANLIFFLGIAVLFLVSLQHASELTRAESQIRSLAEKLALIDLKVRESEREASTKGAKRVNPSPGTRRGSSLAT